MGRRASERSPILRAELTCCAAASSRGTPHSLPETNQRVFQFHECFKIADAIPGCARGLAATPPSCLRPRSVGAFYYSFSLWIFPPLRFFLVASAARKIPNRVACQPLHGHFVPPRRLCVSRAATSAP